MTKAQSIWVMVIGLGLIIMSVYTINTYNKDQSKSATSKIVVDIFAVLFIIGGISAIWAGGKSLAA
jgi:cytochrome bd-type quinol oxidase subunit 1